MNVPFWCFIYILMNAFFPLCSILNLPQLSWSNFSTSSQNSVVSNIESAKLEALLEEYNDTEMSTEEKVNYNICKLQAYVMYFWCIYSRSHLTLIVVSNTPTSHAHLS